MNFRTRFAKAKRKRLAALSVFLGALGLFTPWTAMGANIPPDKTAIVPVPGGATVVSKDKVHSVYPGTVISGDKGNYGMGVYKQFDLSKGNIANMYFHTKNGNVEATDLLNLVNSKININGTVNAIRDNRIGGQKLILLHLMQGFYTVHLRHHKIK